MVAPATTVAGHWPQAQWWKGYQDTTLDRLIDMAIGTGPTIAGADASNQQALDLYVGIVPERKERPVGIRLWIGGQHFNAPDNAVFARGRGELHAPVFARHDVDCRRQIDGVYVRGNGHDLERECRYGAQKRQQETDDKRGDCM